MHKPIIRNLKKYLSFKDNIWDADLVDMQLISKFNKGIGFYYMFLTLLVNMDGLFLWNIKNVTAIANAFQSILNDSKRKPNKILVDKGSEFYNRSMKSWL